MLKNYNKLLLLSTILVAILFVSPGLNANILSVEKIEKVIKKANLYGDIYSSDRDFKSNELIIKFKEDRTIFKKKQDLDLLFGINSIDKLNKKYNLFEIEQLFNNQKSKFFKNIFKLNFYEDADILKIAEEYNKNSFVEFAEPNYYYETYQVSNDPYFGVQWSLNNFGQGYPTDGRIDSPGEFDCDIDAPEAWDLTTGDPNVTVAVVDTGIDYEHEDIRDNIWINSKEDINNNGKFDNWPSWRKKDGVSGDIDNIDNDQNGYTDDVIGYDFVKGWDKKTDNNPKDDNGHGTHCAGIIAAVGNNKKGISGVNWNCRIMTIKSTNRRAAGCSEGIASGITYAVENEADIISLSLGGPNSKLMRNSIEYADKNGITLIAAAGNFNTDLTVYPSYPANLENVICIGATDSSNKKAIFSSYGLTVDVSAPGVDILSLRAKNTDSSGSGTNIVDNEYYIMSGTSMAAPHVAGVAALILSIKPDLDPSEVKTILKSSTDPIIDSSVHMGTGVINAFKAVKKTNQVQANIDFSKKINEIKGSIDIYGDAYGENFSRYSLEYGQGLKPNSWIELQNSTHEIKNNLLSRWNTSSLKEDIYSLRLKVISKNFTYIDTKYFLINNIIETLYVDNKNESIQYNLINSAIEKAGNNDTIFVFNGRYDEDILITKKINLIGENKIKTIINGSINIMGKNETKIKNINFLGTNSGRKKVSNRAIYIHWKSNNVLVENCYIENHYRGIYVESDSCELKNNTIYNCSTGIFLWNGKNSLVQNNKILKNKEGIIIYNSNNNTVENNTAYINEIGVSILSSNNNIIKVNKIKKNDIGLNLGLHANKNKVLKNTFINNKRTAKFLNCKENKWDQNYWGRSRKFPKVIFGRIEFFKSLIPWLNFDWNPAEKPYEI